jgi:predicted metalloprotease
VHPAGAGERIGSVTFDPNARLDPTQVRDVRGRRLGGRGGLAIGGGGLGIVVAIVYLLLGGSPENLGIGSPTDVDTGPGNSTLIEECRTGADANERADCRMVGFVNSVQAFWEEEFGRVGDTYRKAPMVIFSDAVGTACGSATSAVGPFYCPADQTVYLDLGFFEELQSRFGAQGGPLAEGYVVAHEYGHHVQNLTDMLQPGGGGQGAESQAVRTELQADCLAGVWANHAAATGFLQPLTQSDIAQALDAAAAVGDDRIQASSGSGVNPDTWTHGSAQQRQEWFLSGYEQGTSASCDTSGADL